MDSALPSNGGVEPLRSAQLYAYVGEPEKKLSYEASNNNNNNNNKQIITIAT